MIKMKWLVLSLTLFNMLGCQSMAQPNVTVGSAGLSEPLNVVAQVRKNNIDFRKLSQQHNRPIVALVLGSGGARGYAHIGVIQVLEQQGIHPDFIVGTSAGSIVGSIYASGKTANELRDIALNMKVNDVRDIKLDMKGILDGKKVENYINQLVNNIPLQQLKIPMYVVATELGQGNKVVFNYGNTGQAVRASVSIPSMFVPTKIGETEYVDGGLVSPVPVDVARDLGADIIIAVDILAQPIHTETSNVWGLFNQNINIMQHIFDLKGRESTIQAGIDAAENQLHSILSVFQQKQRLHQQKFLQLTAQD